jgi:hypothetical protein
MHELGKYLMSDTQPVSSIIAREKAREEHNRNIRSYMDNMQRMINNIRDISTSDPGSVMNNILMQHKSSERKDTEIVAELYKKRGVGPDCNDMWITTANTSTCKLYLPCGTHHDSWSDAPALPPAVEAQVAHMPRAM